MRIVNCTYFLGLVCLLVSPSPSCGGDTVVLSPNDGGARDSSEPVFVDGAAAVIDGALDPTELRFGALDCVHDRLELTGLAVGSNTSCSVEVMGTAGRTVNFMCENEAGVPILCDCTGAIQMQPCDANERVIPFRASVFVIAVAEPKVFVKILGSDSGGTASTTLDFPVIAANANGINDVPELFIDCGGDTDLDISVEAGSSANCLLMIRDGDDTSDVRVDISKLSGPATIGATAIGGTPPLIIPYSINSSVADSGQVSVVRFALDDSVNGIVIVDLQIRHI